MADGKDSVLEVLRILGLAGFAGVIGIVDADFDRVQGTVANDPNVCVTDTHDAESMLVRSTALEPLLVEFGSADKLDKLGRDVRHVLLEAAAPIGYIRLLSIRSGLNLRFDGLRYSRFVNPRTLAVDWEDLIAEVKGRSQRQDLATAQLLDGMNAIAQEGHPLWEIAAGPDLLAVLSLGFRRALGTNDVGDVSEEQMRRALRLAYNDGLFLQTALRRSIQDWEGRNAPYRLL